MKHPPADASSYPSPFEDEHILVCLSSAPSNANIIRTAAKMATAFGGSFTALYVQTSSAERMAQEERERIQRHIRLAEREGATIATVIGEEIAEQIAEFARLQKVTKVVIGRSASIRSHLFGKKPLTEKLIDLAPFLDVYIIPDMAGDNRRRSPLMVRPVWPTLREWMITLLILLAATAIGFLFDRFNIIESNIVTVYLLGVLLTAMTTRRHLCSITASLLSVLLYSFLFTAPRFSFYAQATGYPVTFAVMLFASLVTGTLANRLSDHTKRSVQAAARTKVLFDTNQMLQKAADDDELLHLTAQQLLKLLGREMIVYPAADGTLGEGTLYQPDESSTCNAFPTERDIAAWVLAHKRRAGATTDVYSDAEGLYLAIRSGGEAYGVVGIHMGDKPLEPFVSSVMLSILGECALAMENSRNAREKEQAAIRAKNEQLRADLLRAISHDLRTPLTSISGNAENLLANDACMDHETRRQIVSDICDDAHWLIQLVENLLSITRISEGRMQLHLSAQLVEEVVTEALRHISRTGSSHHITSAIQDDLMLANMDARLICQVLVNLVDNAVKYTPAGSHISVSACREGAMVCIRVADDGPGIPDAAKDRVFDMFFTGENRVADCHRSLGLGLSLCRSIVEAHGGRISLTDNVPHGAIFTFTIPASEVTLNE